MPDHPILAFIRPKLVDPSRRFSFLVDFLARPGHGPALAAAIGAAHVIPLTHQEPGCVTYDITQDVDVPEKFVAYECWETLDALAAHMRTDHFHRVGAALEEHLAGARRSAS
ncbi:MAG: putative quinol monooxygenase [Pirellulales bacterium]